VPALTVFPTVEGESKCSIAVKRKVFIMPTGSALLVSADSATIQQVSLALEGFSITPEVCKEVPEAVRLLDRQKFDAVIVDLMVGEDAAMVFDAVHLSPSNQTVVTFVIAGSNAERAAFQKSAQFIFERPLSAESINGVLRPAYGLILRERRRYFRCPLSSRVRILREGEEEVLCEAVNVSEGGMALVTLVPIERGESVAVHFALPEHETQFVAQSTICWKRLGRLGIRFVSLSQGHKSELQEWLARKLEETLPEAVAWRFRKEAGMG